MIYLTAADHEKLLTIALDAKDGHILWQDEAPHGQIEQIHQKGSLAQPSPAADGEVIVTFFGSSGLSCYDPSGKLLWRKRMGPFNDGYGAGSSPILCADRVILNEDHDTDSFLMALNKKTGEMIWKTDRSEFPRGYSTPVIWETAAGRQIAVAGTLRLAGYDFESGKEIWTVRGLARIANPTPVIGPEGNLYLAIWAPGGDSGEGGDRITAIAWEDALARDDRNHDGALQATEPSDMNVRARFLQVDRDKDGRITKDEYESMRKIFDEARNAAICVRPGGSGDITATH
ncbi:PQQ-binding-like beta-propeller repeat protein, partial [Candidatus Sumerlaeota bacterium]|nr:PQQ-binding-like beta-propeller repeat protein [Candidatus Sumerlaeota bacterium]